MLNLDPWRYFWDYLADLIGQITPIFDLFKTPQTAIGLSLVLLTIAALFLLYLVSRALPAWFILRRIAAFINEHNATHFAFRSAYPVIRDRIENTSFIRHGWLEFVETIVISEDERHPIRNTVRPQHYLSVHSADSLSATLRLFQHLPNYFVGVGLLFTFVGLVAAIYFASEGVASPRVEEAQDALKNLLHAATFKFLTSIAGLLSSIILSIANRYATERLQNQFSRICESLERGMLFVTREALAFEQLVEMRQQTQLQKRFNAEFAVEVGKVIEERMRGTMTESLEEALRPLRLALEQMTGNVGEMNQKALADMAAAFRDDLKSSAGKEMDALVATLGLIEESLSSVVSKIDGSGTQLGTRIEESAAKMDAFLTAAGSRLNESTQTAADAFATKIEHVSTSLGEALSPLASHIGRFKDSIDQLEDKLTRQRDAFADVAERVQQITSSVGSTITELRDATSPLRGIADQIRDVAIELTGAGSSASEAHSALQQLSGKLETAVVALESAWNGYSGRFAEVDQSLANAINNLTAGADAYRERVTQFVTELDKQLDRSVKALGAGIQALQNSIDELVESRTVN